MAQEDKKSVIHSELVGHIGLTGELVSTVSASGMKPEAEIAVLDRLLHDQRVMLATNLIVEMAAVVFALSACPIWLAPRPSRTVIMTQSGH